MKKWIFAIFILLFFLFLPQLSSSFLGKPFFIFAMEKKTGCQIKVASLQFSWFGPQKFQSVAWSHEEATGWIDELLVMSPFWSFSAPFEIKNGSVEYAGGTISGLNAKIEGKSISLTAGGDLSLNTSFHYTKEGLYLDQPLDLSFKITPGISQWLLKDANPFFITAVSSKTPAHLTILPESFFCPLPFSLKQLSIGKATLDLGQIDCKNGKSISALIHLLKANPFATSSDMSIWLTPLDFRLQNGRLEAERMDLLLAGSIHICTWGEIDLLKERLHMFVGLPADLLRKSFGIKNLSPNYVLKIPLQGSPKDPELVTGPASAKIAALIATGQIPSAKLGPFGKVKDLFIGPKIDPEVPPLKYPLPWNS